MTAGIFVAYLVIVVAVALAAVRRFLSTRFMSITIVLGVWLTYVGLLAIFGVMRDPHLRPPGAAFVIVPLVVLIASLSVSTTGAKVAAVFPVWTLVAIQCFRVGVELLIHQLWKDGLVPQLMTFEGGNVDIYIGLSAPLVAWVATRGRLGLNAALVWNIAGLAALANIVARALGTTPGLLHVIDSEIPDIALGQWPFVYLAGFFVPLALVSHVLSIRGIRQRIASIER